MLLDVRCMRTEYTYQLSVSHGVSCAMGFCARPSFKAGFLEGYESVFARPA